MSIVNLGSSRNRSRNTQLYFNITNTKEIQNVRYAYRMKKFRNIKISFMNPNSLTINSNEKYN